MEQYLSFNQRIYFEAICVIELESIGSIGNITSSKLFKFCKESSLSMYYIKFMDGSFKNVLFLTKQRLIPFTGYYCSSSNLGVRAFAGVEVMVANTVKRIMPKSDSKFIEKFAQLLETETIYCRKVSPKHLLIFSRQSEYSLKFWYSEVKEHSRIKLTEPKSHFTDFSQPTSTGDYVIDNANLLHFEQTYALISDQQGHPTLIGCQINPPNILCTMWRDPSIIIKYFQRKALEGNKEEGECKVGYMLSSQESSKLEGYHIHGLGLLVLPEDRDEKNKRSPSKANTCESTPEQNRGFAQFLKEEDDSSESFDQTSSKAIAQTLALLSSDKKRSAPRTSSKLALFLQLKNKIKPGRGFSLFN